MAELDGGRITAVLAADTAVKLGSYLLTKGNSHIHQLANTGGVKTSKRIGLVNLVSVVCRQELAGIG